MGIDNGISGGQDRVIRIQKLLKEAPDHVTTLVLATYPDRVELASWDRTDWSDSLAMTIDVEMVEHHEQAGVSDSHFVCILYDENKRSRKQRTFDVRTRKTLSAPTDMDVTLSLDGTVPAANALQQNILYMTGMQSQLNSANETIKMLTALLRDSETNARSARDEYHELRELMAEIRETQGNIDSHVNVDMTPAQAKFLEIAQQSLPVILARMSGKGPAQS